jgi:hypothetical protein
MRSNGTASREYAYIPLPQRIRIGRPSLHTLPFFVALANLTRSVATQHHLHGNALLAVWFGCVVTAPIAGTLVDHFAKGERTSRCLTGTLGLTSLQYTTLSIAGTGAEANVQLIAAGLVVIFTLLGEVGYLAVVRRPTRRHLRSNAVPARHASPSDKEHAE